MVPSIVRRLVVIGAGAVLAGVALQGAPAAFAEDPTGGLPECYTAAANVPSAPYHPSATVCRP